MTKRSSPETLFFGATYIQHEKQGNSFRLKVATPSGPSETYWYMKKDDVLRLQEFIEICLGDIP